MVIEEAGVVVELLSVGEGGAEDIFDMLGISSALGLLCLVPSTGGGGGKPQSLGLRSRERCVSSIPGFELWGGGGGGAGKLRLIYGGGGNTDGRDGSAGLVDDGGGGGGRSSSTVTEGRG